MPGPVGNLKRLKRQSSTSRIGEIASLTWDCIDADARTIRVLDTKGGRDRLVPMTARLQALFKSMTVGKAGELVFPGRHGQIITEPPSSFRTAINDAKLNDNIINKKLRATFHTLRHTYASRLVQSDVDLYKVQRLLGHSTPIMTARYSKLADDDLRQAVAAMEQYGKIEKSKGKVIRLRKAK